MFALPLFLPSLDKLPLRAWERTIALLEAGSPSIQHFLFFLSPESIKKRIPFFWLTYLSIKPSPG